MVKARNVIRKSSLGLALLFCAYAAVTVSVRSSQRKSIFTASDASASGMDYFAGMDEPETAGSRLHLQEFHRIAVKDGQPVWEVEASDAQYYSKEGVTHLNDANLTVHREGGSKVRLQAKSAKLLSNEGTLARAELVGDIVVELEKGLVIKTDLALYYVLRSQISAPGHVIIQGEGYSIEGDELTADLAAQTLKLSSNVVSVFTPGAKAPEREIFLRAKQ